jgi:hypothetical protein
LIGVFNGYDLAFREHREGSALLYVHLVPTDNLYLKAHVVDKIGFERVIDLDPVVFLIQRKGDTLRTRIRQLMEEKRLEDVEEAIACIVQMYVSEYQKGIYDHDHGVMHNTGFIGTRPFHLDVGKLNRDQRMKEVSFYKKDLEHVLWKIDDWVKCHYPLDHPRLSAYLSGLFEQWTGESTDLSAIDPKRFKKIR